MKEKIRFFRILGKGVLGLGGFAFFLLYLRLFINGGWEAISFDLSMLIAALICFVPGYLLLRIACIMSRFDTRED